MERINPSTAGLTQRISNYDVPRRYEVGKSKKDEYRIVEFNELKTCTQNQY